MKKLSFIFLFLLLPVAQALEIGDYAEYEFSGYYILMDDDNAILGFQGSYRWEIVDEDEDYYHVKVTLIFTFPKYFEDIKGKTFGGHIAYKGKKLVEQALKGDFSFATLLPEEYTERLPILYKLDEPFEISDSIKDRAEIYIEKRDEKGNIIEKSDTKGKILILAYEKEVVEEDEKGSLQIVKEWVHEVHFPPGVTSEFTFDLKVDKDTREVYNSNGKLGKWMLWINPDKYPLHGMTEEVFIENYFGKSIKGRIEYLDLEEIYWYPKEYMKKGYFSGIVVSEEDVLSINNNYDPDKGILVWCIGDYLDDIFTSLGIKSMSLFCDEDKVTMKIVDTNINLSSEETKAFNYLYLLPIPIIVGLILIYIAVKKK